MTEETTPAKLKPLSLKHEEVLKEYLKCFRQVDSYLKVYPTAKYNAAKSASSRLFTNANFLAHLQARREEIHMGEDEAFKLQSDIARGDLGDFTQVDEGGNFITQEGQKPPNTRLLKKFKHKVTRFTTKDGGESETTELEVQTYPADQAQVNILKIHGKFKDKGDSGDVKTPITIVEIVRPNGK